MFEVSELRFLETEIRETKTSVSKTFNPPSEIEPGHFMTYDEEEQNDLLEYYIHRLYVLMLAYFEAKGLVSYAEQFKANFAKDIYNRKKVLSVKHHDGDPYLVMYHNILRFLAPFKSLSNKEKRDVEFDNMMSILNETPHVLSKLNLNPKNEAEIYKQVQWVLNFYFDTRPTNKARFIGKFKTYRPDILLPEIETAIEYKLAKNRNALDDYIDQIAVDAINYRRDPFYKEFVAVICLRNNIATRKDVTISWKSKKFNDHWHLVVVSL